jgi:hypothetical protein
MPVISTAVRTLLKRQSPATARYDWILAITFIAYIFSAASNGANDVANSYATSVYVLPDELLDIRLTHLTVPREL